MERFEVEGDDSLSITAEGCGRYNCLRNGELNFVDIRAADRNRATRLKDKIFDDGIVEVVEIAALIRTIDVDANRHRAGALLARGKSSDVGTGVNISRMNERVAEASLTRYEGVAKIQVERIESPCGGQIPTGSIIEGQAALT